MQQHQKYVDKSEKELAKLPGKFTFIIFYITALAREVTPEHEKTVFYTCVLKGLRKPHRVLGPFLNDSSFKFNLRTTGLYLMRILFKYRFRDILTCLARAVLPPWPVKKKVPPKKL